MGIAFITSKAEKFKQRRDAAFEEQMASENLLSGLPDAVEPTFRCNCTTGELPLNGTLVLLYRSADKINVFHINERIGIVMTPDAADLITLMQRANTEVLSAVVVETHPMSRVFVVRLTRSAF